MALALIGINCEIRPEACRERSQVNSPSGE